MIIQMNEMESMNGDDPEIISQVMLDDLETYVVSEELYWKEKHRQERK